MAYDDLTKSEAFILYCQGISFRKIAEILRTRPGCEKVTHSTVQKWAETPDTRGLTWEDRRSETRAIIEKTEKDVIVKQHRDMITETDGIKEKIIDDIKSGELDFKTKEGAIHAFIALSRWQENIKDKEKRVSIEDQVTLFIEAMHEIPEVSEVLSKHWPLIHKRFQEKAKELMRKKQRG